MSSLPITSFGLPVYNGERYLERAIDCILGQADADWELIISDNASTDTTEEICRGYAETDRRVRYSRHTKNRGAAWNFNYCFRQARGRYFKWVPADDEHQPTWLTRCRAMLDTDPSVVCVYTPMVEIDTDGRFLTHHDNDLGGELPSAHERFRSLILQDHECAPVMGLFRREILARTGLIRPYADSDDVLVAEVALYGRLHGLPEHLYLRRVHNDRSVTAAPRSRDRVSWFDTSKVDRISFPAWRLGREYLDAVSSSPLSSCEKARCYAVMLPWLRRNWMRMVRNVAWAGRELLRRLLSKPGRPRAR